MKKVILIILLLSVINTASATNQLINASGSYISEFGYSVPSSTFYSTNNPVAIQYSQNTYVVWNNQNFNSIISKISTSNSSNITNYNLGLLGIADSHGSPSIMINSTGHIYVFSGGWNSNEAVNISRNPEDITTWTNSTITGNVTYVHPFNVNDATIYAYYRLRVGANDGSAFFTDTEGYSVSNDYGLTWSAPQTFINFSTGTPQTETRIYANGIKGADGKYHLTWSYCPDRSCSVRKNIYYAYTTDGTSWFNSAGTALSTPITLSNAELVYNSGSAYALADDIETFNNRPYILYYTNNGFYLTYFNGAAWVNSNKIASSGTASSTNTYHGTLRIVNSNEMYAYVTTAGTSQDGGLITKYKSTDGGINWLLDRSITQVVSIQNNFPKTVQDSTLGNIEMVWSRGNSAPSQIYGFFVPLPFSIWAFNDAANNIANDSKYLNNGTIINPTWSTSLTNGSINGTALYFNGSSVVNITHNQSLPIYNATYPYSISFWVKGSSGQVGARLFAEGSSTGNNPLFTINTNNTGSNDKIEVMIRKDDGSYALTPTDSSASVFDNRWHHIVWTDTAGTATLYIDGTADITSFSYTPSAAITLDKTAIGGLIRAAISNNFTGVIDEVQVFNKTLEPLDVVALYNQFQPTPIYPTGGITITAVYPPQTTQVNFSWVDAEYPGDRLEVATDINFNIKVVDITTTNDYYLSTLNSADTYYWRVRQFDGTTGLYGNTSQTQTFTISSASSATGQGVQGVVYELIDGLPSPVNQAEVHIYNNTYSDFMVTGSNGYFLFDGLANDTYYVYAIKQDYDQTGNFAVTVNGSLATQNILMKKYISPYVPNFVYEKFIVRGLFDNSFSGVTVSIYEGDSLTISQTGTTDSMGQAVFRLIKDQKYRVVFSGGGIGSDITVTVYAKEESYYVRVMSGFPTGGDRNTDITSNLTSIAINSTWSNLSLIYNDTRSSTLTVWFYARNLSTNTTCYVSSASNNITLSCPVVASGRYQFGFNATSSVYGFFKLDKVINFDVGKPDTPAITTNINKTLLQWASIILIVLTAALFSVKTVKFGAVIVPLEALVLWAFGWFEPAGGNVVASLLLLSCAVCLGIMVYLRQSESKAVYQ